MVFFREFQSLGDAWIQLGKEGRKKEWIEASLEWSGAQKGSSMHPPAAWFKAAAAWTLGSGVCASSAPTQLRGQMPQLRGVAISIIKNTILISFLDLLLNSCVEKP